MNTIEPGVKIAFVSDIHSNYEALTTVHNDIGDEPNIVMCLGDIIGYGPRPRECLELVREWADVSLAGNHEETLPNPRRYSANRMAWKGLEHASNELTTEQKEWIESLPARKDFAGRGIIAHSHPDPKHHGAYLTAGSMGTLIPLLAEGSGVEFIAYGHTHNQHVTAATDITHDRRVSGVSGVVLNPGSVGQPRDGDPRAAYAIVTVQEDGFDVDLRRVEYDIETVQDQIRNVGLPHRTASRLEIGK